MHLRLYIRKIGDEKAAELFGSNIRRVKSWRLGARKPRPEQAMQIVRATRGKVGFDEVYSELADPMAAKRIKR